MFDAFYNFLTESLLFLYQLVGNNYILAITVFTIIIRVITLPLNLRQQRSMMHTQELQPQISAIQKKYRDNPQKMQEEFTKIGYNPADALMGCLPMLIQFPILIGMYRAIQYTLGSTPLDLYELSLRTNTVDLASVLPIENTFLWLNLAQPDPFYILPVLVGGGMYLQQKLFMPTTNPQNDKDNPAAAMTRSMLYTMPLMFGMFSLSFPAGLSIYFIVSNVIGIGQGYITKRNMDRLKAEAALKPKPQVVFDDEGEAEQPQKVAAAKSQPSTNGRTTTRKQQAKKKNKSKR
ncbi:MAG: membrane protein insertase YidC [Anaerolineae bacterium]|nr:membrane protein insertase YidC [Anaerolineae bacterium]